MPAGRTKKKLTDIHDAASNVAADEIRVHVLEVGGRKDAARQYAITEAGSEALNLVFEFLQHVDSRSVGHMAVSPCRVLTRGSARTIEKTGLSEKNERTIWMPAAAHGLFRISNLLKGSAEMQACSLQTLAGFPGDGRTQRVIDLERGGAVTILPKPALIA